MDDRARLLAFLQDKLGDPAMDLVSVDYQDARDLVELTENPAMPGVPRHRKGPEGDLFVRVKYLMAEGE